MKGTSADSPLDRPKKRDGCSICLVSGSVIFLLLIAFFQLGSAYLRWDGERSQKIAMNLKPGDLDGIWEGKWDDKTARMTIRGDAVSVEQFPVDDSDDGKVFVAIKDSGTLNFPFHGTPETRSSGRLKVGDRFVMLDFNCPLWGEVEPIYFYDPIGEHEITFTRISP